MRDHLQRVYRVLGGWPVIGTLVRGAVALLRLPGVARRMRTFETEQLPGLLHMLPELADSVRRQRVFESEQLPTLLQTLSDLNHRQLSSSAPHQNLLRSVPVSLRKLMRDLRETQGMLQQTREQADAMRGDIGDLRSQTQRGCDHILDSRSQLEHIDACTRYLLDRVEFVRRELMFEMRHGACPPRAEKQLRVRSKIIETEKVEAARAHGIRINIGSGHLPLAGYLNLDRRELPGVDIVAEADDLPFGPEELVEIRSAHFLEHFPQEELRRSLLPYWHSLLGEGGVFRAAVPDAPAMVRA
jgi:hypothetical protein